MIAVLLVAAALATPLAFGGLSLEAAEQMAQARSPEVLVARARAEQGAAALAEARGVSIPSLVAGYTQTPQGNPPGAQIVSRVASAGLQLNLADLMAAPPAIRAASLEFAAARADVSAAERSERSKAVAFYFDALKARAIGSAHQAALALAGEQLDAARRRFAAGDAPHLDVIRAEVASEQARADLAGAEADDANADDALRNETGCAATALNATVAGTMPDVPPTALKAETAAELALRLRVEIVSADARVAAARANARAAHAAGFPGLTVGAGYANGTDSGAAVNGPQVSAQLTVPLGGIAHARAASADAQVTEAQANAIATRRGIALAVAAAARTATASIRAAEALTRARDAAQDELRATALGYAQGASSSLEVSSARVTYVQAVVADLSALYDEAKALATFSLQAGR